ncbi:hypothetical protein FRX31_018227, partial [Thalictrum thalictroides]
MSNVWKAMVALELEDQLKIKAMGLVHGMDEKVEILDNPKYKNDRKRWQKICNCTFRKSVASSSAKAFLDDSVSSSCAVEILDNPKYKNNRKRWQKICNCTLTKSVASSSAKAFLADSVSLSCA